MRIDFYYILLFAILFLLNFIKGRDDIRFKWAVGITFVFIGLRACVVGADTYNYTLGYMGLNYYKSKEIEPLYNIYVNGLGAIIRYKPFFIFVNTICSLTPLYLLVKKYSDIKVLSILWFFIFGIYISYFIALRQILGLSLLLFGVLYVMDNKKYKWVVYSLFVIIAFGFHTSTLIPAILYVFVYFVNIKSRRFVLLLITVSGLLGIVLQAFSLTDIFNFYLNLGTNLTTDRLNAYMMDEHMKNVHETSGYIYTLRYVWLGLFIYYFIDNDKLNHWFSKIFIVAICLYNLFYSVDMIGRINLGFDIFSIVVVTWAFGERYKRFVLRNRFVRVVPVLVFLWFVQAYIRFHIDYDLNNVDRMHPYYFFWEDYQTHPSITRF